MNTTSWCIYDFICATLEATGKSPRRQEIVRACGVTADTVGYHVSRIVGMGYLKRLPERTQNLRLTRKTPTLDERAAAWIRTGATLIWYMNAQTKRYVGFQAVAVGRGVVAEVRLANLDSAPREA